jgi:hypothetical protein
MCDHTAWLGLVAGSAAGSHGAMLLEFNRLQTLLALRVFPNPSTQTPSLITFIGGSCKTRVVRGLVSPFKSFKSQDHSNAHIHAYPPAVNHDKPVLLADYTFPRQIQHEQFFYDINCHEVFWRSLSWTNRSGQELKPRNIAENVLARLLAPFSDVVCVFSSDLGGLVGVGELLEALMRKGLASTLPPVIRPAVFVVMDDAAINDPHTSLIAKQFLLEMIQRNFSGEISAYFSNLTVLCISSRKPQALLGHILPAVAEMQKRRKEARYLFSLDHFCALFKHACDHFSRTITEPIDLVKFSRLQNPVPQAFSRHLAEFLGQLPTEVELTRSGIPLIASSIFLDSSPPGMHGRSSSIVIPLWLARLLRTGFLVFNPIDTFRLFYRDHCNAAIRAHPLCKQQSSVVAIESLLEYQFGAFVLDFEKNHKTSAQLHRATLANHRKVWRDLRSETTCFSCLARGPEKGLPCGHAMCEICIQVFGCSVAESYIFTLDQCPLCGARTEFSGFKTHIKPPTAGIRVLSIDGGGIRGVVPLSTLRELEQTISRLAGLSYPIQENFDLAYGTSSGGLVVFGLFLNGWSVEECMEKFVALARRAFRPRDLSLPFLRKAQRFLISYFADSRYSATGLEAALKDAFGTGTMLEWSRSHDFGVKVAVTATTVESSSPCIFPSYSGMGTRSAECGT